MYFKGLTDRIHQASLLQVFLRVFIAFFAFEPIRIVKNGISLEHNGNDDPILYERRLGRYHAEVIQSSRHFTRPRSLNLEAPPTFSSINTYTELPFNPPVLNSTPDLFWPPTMCVVSEIFYDTPLNKKNCSFVVKYAKCQDEKNVAELPTGNTKDLLDRSSFLPLFDCECIHLRGFQVFKKKPQ